MILLQKKHSNTNRNSVNFLAFIALVLFFVSHTLSAQVNIADSTRKKIDAMVNEMLVQPLNEQSQKLSLSDFSRAYIAETFVYDIYAAPDKKNKYYLCMLKEMKGAFITEKILFKLYYDKKYILVEDKKTKTFIEHKKWLEEREKREK